MDIPYDLYVSLAEKLKILKAKVWLCCLDSVTYCKIGLFIKLIEKECMTFQCEYKLKQMDLTDSMVESTIKNLTKVHSTLIYCLDELGVWLAFKVFFGLQSTIISWHDYNVISMTGIIQFTFSNRLHRSYLVVEVTFLHGINWMCLGRILLKSSVLQPHRNLIIVLKLVFIFTLI